MPYDGFTTAAIRLELEEKLLNSRVDKVHQPNRDEISLGMRQPGESYRLLLSANPSYSRVHLSGCGKDGNYPEAPAFAMLLRKHLRGARLLSVTQPAFDRILHFRLETYDDFARTSSGTLIAEIMGRHSNVILTDSDSTILDGIHRVSDEMSRFREVLPGRRYLAPPDQNRLDPRGVSEEFFINLMLSGDETKALQKTLLTNFTGLSPIICREIAARAGLSPDTPKGAVSPGDAGRIWGVFAEMMDLALQGRFEPVMYIDGETGTPVDFSAMPLKVMEDPDLSGKAGKNLVMRRYSSMSEVVDDYYTRKDQRERLEQDKSEIRRLLRQQLERCDRKLILQEESKRDAENAEDLKIRGDLLMANLHRLKKGADSVRLPNLYSEDMEDMEVLLEPSLSPLDNAQRYYRKYARARNSLKTVAGQIERTWEEVAYLGQVEVALDSAGSQGEIQEIRDELIGEGYLRTGRKKGKALRQTAAMRASAPLRHSTSDGFEILIGKNNKQNDLLTMKMAGPGDIWFHTKNIPGSHVILRTSGQPSDSVPRSSLLEAAAWAAAYSKAKESANVPVDYCLRKNVRKPPGSKPGMVIYDSQKTLYVNPHRPS